MHQTDLSGGNQKNDATSGYNLRLKQIISKTSQDLCPVSIQVVVTGTLSTVKLAKICFYTGGCHRYLVYSKPGLQGTLPEESRSTIFYIL